MDTQPQPVIQTKLVYCDISGTTHALMVSREAAAPDPASDPLHRVVVAEFITVDGSPVERLQHPDGRNYYLDPRTGKTYSEK